jgi:hypothetical protein
VVRHSGAAGLSREKDMRSLCATTLSLAALAAPACAQAEVNITFFGVQNYSAVPYAPNFCAGCTNQYTHTDTFSNGATTLQLYGMADYGVLKVAARTEGGGLAARSAGSATGSVVDNITIDAAGLTGRQGYFTAQVSVPFAGSYESRGGSAANVGLTAGIVLNDSESYSLQAGYNETGRIISVRHNDTEVSPDAPMILNVPFVYGTPITLWMYMDANVSGRTGPGPAAGSFSLLMDASHSMYWEGITSVTDGFGSAVTGYTLTSDSGTDWTKNFATPAVPEPAAMVLMLAGLSAIVLTRRVAGRMNPNKRPPAT